MNNKYTLIIEITGHGVLMNAQESTMSSKIVTITKIIIRVDSYRIKNDFKNHYKYI